MKGNKRGGIPKPTALKILEGNPGKRPLNKREPKPRGRPQCPAWLPREAKNEWKRMSTELERLGLLTSVDRAAFASYCLAWDRLINAEKVLQEQGLVMSFPRDDGTEYLQQRPEVSISNKAMIQIRAFCVEFGLTPASRARMQLPEEVAEKSKLEELLD